MTEVLADFAPAALVTAIEENFFEGWSNFGRVGGELYRDEEITRIASLIPYIPYNGVLRTHYGERNIDGKIRANIAYFAARRAQMLWAITPSTRPAVLAHHLHRFGFAPAQDLVGMAADLATFPNEVRLPAHTVIREVSDLRSLREFVDLVAWRWHLPADANDLVFELNRRFGFDADKPGRRWLAYQDGEPVAKAFLYLGAGVAGIYGVSTVPSRWRQGLGAAITLTALAAAREKGYRIAILHSTPMAENLYRRLGFREYCKLSMYTLT
jgi:GNAT superfamily N-acetyltransferase